jgi:hypothetical protein
MRHSLFLFLSFSFCFAQQENEAVLGSQQTSSPPVNNSALPSDFFADALSDAQASQDELGTQRLVEVKSSELSPTISLSTALKYTSNPEKSSLSTKKEDGTTMDLSLMFMLGLGEYGIGDDVVCSPSLMLMHLRTYNDTFKDFGTDMRLFDVDVQIASLTFPFVLPNDYTLSVGNTYVRPISFRNDGDSPNLQFNGNILSYSNTPSISLSKTIPLENGHILNLTAGLSYAYSNGDTLSESLGEATFQTLQSLVGLENTLSNVQDGLTHSLGISYIIPVNDKLTLTPSLSLSRMFYKKGANYGRKDNTYILGGTASYTISDSVSLTGAANYTAKFSNGVNAATEFRDFVGGFTLAVNHSF